MDIDKIMMLIDKVSQSPVNKLSIEDGLFKIAIEKGGVTGNEIIVQEAPVVMTKSTPVVQETPVVQPVSAEGDQMITSPIVGVFYAAPSPDAEDFIKVGDKVSKGQIVGIVEAMKLMNEIESEVDGIVTEILVKNEQGVEYGQPLFRVK